MTQDDDQQPQTLAMIFAEQARVARAVLEEEAAGILPVDHTQPTALVHKRPTLYRTYMGGLCQNPECGADLGCIEVAVGRDRHYCDVNCRVAHHRQQKREEKRRKRLLYHSELREYWIEHQIRGRVLAQLQEILIKHGKDAAQAATDAVLWDRYEHAQTTGNERSRLLIELFDLGDKIDYAALMDVNVAGQIEAWSWFADRATPGELRTAVENAQRIQTAPARKERLQRRSPVQEQ